MKRLLAVILAMMSLAVTGLSAYAAETKTQEFTIVVSGQTLELGTLPRAPYREGDTVMVPLCEIAQALGYRVSRDAATGAVTIEDAYVQRATVLPGTRTVVFEGKLKIIDMSREVENVVESVVYDGSLYVPVEFFTEFMNDVEIDGTVIRIAPSMCELQGASVMD